MQSVTSAGWSTSDLVASRSRSYLLLQAVRVVAFLVAIAAPLPLWLRVVLLTAAGVLSFVSVTAANAPREFPPAGRGTPPPPGPLALP